MQALDEAAARSFAMATKLTDYIKCYDGMFDETFCKSVIQAFNQSKS